MNKKRMYVSPILELSQVGIESGFAVSITNSTTIKEEGREEDDSNDIEFYF